MSRSVRPVGRSSVGEVDVDAADADLVVVVQLAHRGGTVLAVADAAVEVDVGRRHDAERQHERQRGHDQPARAAHEGGADQDEPGHHRQRGDYHAAPQGSREADAQGRTRDGDGEEGGEEDPSGGAGRVVGCRSAESAPEQEAGQPDNGDDEQAGAEEEERSAEKRHQRDPQHDGAGHRGRLARAARARLAVGRHEGEQQQVGEHADAADEGERHEADAEQQRVDVEVAGEPGGDAADHGVRAGPGQAAWLGSGSVWGGVSSVMEELSGLGVRIPIGNDPHPTRIQSLTDVTYLTGNFGAPTEDHA